MKEVSDVNEGEFKKRVLEGKIVGDSAREVVDASYVWSAIDEACKDKDEILKGPYEEWSFEAELANWEKWFLKWFGSEKQ
jgi:hypothetical protein